MSARWWPLALCLLAAAATGKEYPARGTPEGTIALYSTLDTAVFEPLLVDFQRLHPGIGVHYENLDATPQYERFVRESDQGIRRADLLISTSMDLQVKLVNDGYTARHLSGSVAALPAWARWRDEAFGFTFEPAVMVFNREAMKGRVVPQSRAELIDQIRRDPEFWRGRIGTYDISRSSVGYLLASQDVRHSSEFGALVEAFGDMNLQVEEHTATLLERIEKGELVAGYNLLGSYARARPGSDRNFLLVYPRDHTLVVARTVVIARNAPNPALAHKFLEYLLSVRGQRVMASQCGLPPIRKELDGVYERLGVNESQVGVLRPISLGPGLLVYLDQHKRRQMLEAWRAILGDAP
ncbi:ABC transporter substrate-binding protein [Pseudoxanthomonas broegbernensis]|uniref:ABC transporter substrate-binding protein n=1 Tax=Pseudoxanthomonas broegbernensis TaxID=83619 RepID=A0A7V8K6M4_9GAMM|nr:ABC transporter substrate-binding protein [Pseudoxanthomonas broegbernensis]KAF1685365.1 ABC transporter substrate-binding protein [Pseudoxanthomonas broegbernensis]MBB6066427.1 iron(III) transport system substrate-binding protein [Pseudoxanthomonas broegbernensis]